MQSCRVRLGETSFSSLRLYISRTQGRKKIPALDGEKTLSLDGAVYKRKKSPLVTNGPYFYSIYLSPLQRKFDNFPFSALSLFFKNTDKKWQHPFLHEIPILLCLNGQLLNPFPSKSWWVGLSKCRFRWKWHYINFIYVVGLRGESITISICLLQSDRHIQQQWKLTKNIF